jgi:S1-C subfamily serine protease
VDLPATAVTEERDALRANATVAAQVAATVAAVPTATSAPTLAPSATPTLAPSPERSPTAPSLEEAVAAVKRSTVLVVATLPTGFASGSGIAVGQGQVLTNVHVVNGATRVQVRFADNRAVDATVARLDPRRDLALLQTAERDEPAATFRDARELRAGEELIVVGYPRPDVVGVQDMSLTRGLFSSRWQEPQTGVWYVQTDAAMNHGNSGGPVADTQGRVVGVVRFSFADTVGLNFAVASDEVAAFLAGGGIAPTQQSTCSSARLTLGRTSLQTARAAPGEQVTFLYTVTNDGDSTVRVVLGASIQSPGGTAWIDDPSNDLEVSVPPGTGAFSRRFRVPAGTAPGSYTAAWGLFCADHSASHGLSVASGVLTVPGPTASSPVPADDPAQAVRQFYTTISAGDLDGAWLLLSPRFRGTQTQGAWASGYRTTRSAQVANLQVSSRTSTTATVSFTLVTVDDSADGPVTQRFSGSWSLVRAQGRWLLDQADIDRVG